MSIFRSRLCLRKVEKEVERKENEDGKYFCGASEISGN
jgi:hypothetical protein